MSMYEAGCVYQVRVAYLLRKQKGRKRRWGVEKQIVLCTYAPTKDESARE